MDQIFYHILCAIINSESDWKFSNGEFQGNEASPNARQSRANNYV